MTYPIVLDVWEGQLEVDEAEALRGGVDAIIIRLNSIAGGHNKDDNFDNQWRQAFDSALLRAPYFVYSPYYTGAQNFDWLVANCPVGVRTVFVDVEVRKDGYAPTTYASQFAAFMSRAQQAWPNVVTYTGGWFLPYLAYWPTTCPYWWARYPLIFYPPARESWSWEQLHTKLAAWSWNPGNNAPARVPLHQISGDRILLPCSIRALDISIFNGTVEELRAFFGSELIPALTPEEKLARLWNAHPELH